MVNYIFAEFKKSFLFFFFMQNVVVCFAISCRTSPGFMQMPKPVSLVVICRTNRWKIGGDLNLIVFCGSWHWTRIWIVNRRLCPWEASDHNSSFSRAVIFSFSPSCNFIIFSLQTLILSDFDFICPISNIFSPQLSKLPLVTSFDNLNGSIHQ